MTSLHEATKTDLSPDFSGFGDKTKYVSKFLQFPRTVHLVKRHGFFKFVTFTTLQSKPVHIKQVCVSHAGTWKSSLVTVLSPHQYLQTREAFERKCGDMSKNTSMKVPTIHSLTFQVVVDIILWLSLRSVVPTGGPHQLIEH